MIQHKCAERIFRIAATLPPTELPLWEVLNLQKAQVQELEKNGARFKHAPAGKLRARSAAPYHQFRSFRQNAAILGGFAAHLEVVIRFESNFADGALGGFLVAVERGHYADRERTVGRKNDAYIVPHGFQVARLIGDLNAV